MEYQIIQNLVHNKYGEVMPCVALWASLYWNLCREWEWINIVKFIGKIAYLRFSYFWEQASDFFICKGRRFSIIKKNFSLELPYVNLWQDSCCLRYTTSFPASNCEEYGEYHIHWRQLLSKCEQNHYTCPRQYMFGILNASIILRLMHIRIPLRFLIWGY